VLEERARLGRDMHDTIAQTFTAVALRLDCAAADLPDQPQAAAAQVREARRLVEEGSAEARRAIWALRPIALERGDLARAIEIVAGQVAAGRALTVQVAGPARPLGAVIEEQLLRIAGEAMTNAVRHGHATQLEVRLEFRRKSVRLVVKDDGGGLQPATADQPHQGLRGMDERARALGGSLRVHSGAGGTEIEVEVPT
jgi:signal transduction histidine kinase